MDVPPGLESMLGHTANAPEKPQGRSMTATFGLQSAHADGADEVDAVLDDVPSAGLNGVDRRHRGVFHRDGRQDQEMSASTHAGNSPH